MPPPAAASRVRLAPPQTGQAHGVGVLTRPGEQSRIVAADQQGHPVLDGARDGQGDVAPRPDLVRGHGPAVQHGPHHGGHRHGALRYFASHGPAPVTDLTRWARLTVAETRTAVALARPSLASIDVEGAEHLLDPAAPDLLREHHAQAEGVLALPGFDELVLGHRDRRAQLEPEHAEKVVPGGNGVFRPTVVHAGRVVGTWSRGRGASTATPSATPFTRFTPQVETALPGVLAALP